MAGNSGFSKAELTAMKERAAELRAEKGGAKKGKNLEALLALIDELPADDKRIAVALHQAVTEVAPELVARTWYGMPAYEQDGDVLVFLQVTSKFDTRYSTLGFNHAAKLDDGDMWPTSFAIPAVTDEVEKRMRELIRTAVGG